MIGVSGELETHIKTLARCERTSRLREGGFRYGLLLCNGSRCSGGGSFLFNLPFRGRDDGGGIRQRCNGLEDKARWPTFLLTGCQRNGGVSCGGI